MKKTPANNTRSIQSTPKIRISSSQRTTLNPDPETQRQLQPSMKSLFPIVGIGASAGGLEAISQLLKNLPTDTGLAFVVIQHLDPTRESILASLLARTTKMPVLQVKDGMVVEPNHVYVFPPNMNMSIENKAFMLVTRIEPRELHMPVDHFFRSLAQLGSQAIGIILSGTGTDGTLGLMQIKEEGGISFAQEEVTAKFAGMPHSAIQAGSVDFILPVEEIAKELVKIAHHPYVRSPIIVPKVDTISHSSDNQNGLGHILQLLQNSKGVNFAHYKSTTILRRITRRMALAEIVKLEEYAQFIQKNPDELKALYQDILIKVTSFFRDPETYESLKTVVIPKITEHHSAGEPIRIWIPGCSSGEEVYSIAICFLECLSHKNFEPLIQIFATDIDEGSLEKARAAVYIENIAADVSQERLKRFFTKIDHRYRINKSIREMCTFAKHDLGKDPPFSNLDLISCRNVLIYFDPSLQKRVIPVFHYALKPTGFLTMGTSETIGTFSDLFNPTDKKSRIYAKKPVKTTPTLNFTPWTPHTAEAQKNPMVNPIDDSSSKAVNTFKEADRILLNHYVPAGVLINDQMEILQFRGDTGRYLVPSPGKASLNLLKMAREGLLAEIKSAVAEAKKTNEPISRGKIHIKFDGIFLNIRLKVIPLHSAPHSVHEFIVLFEEPRPPSGKSKKEIRDSVISKKDAGSREIQHLKHELDAIKQSLQSTIESQDITNEELKSANEEILSSNEELQSTNEELETAKEELQSTNEELITANEEVKNRNSELTQAYNDLNNLFNSVNISIIILGSDLRVREYTKTSEKVLNISSTDIGRPINHLKLDILVPDIEALVSSAIKNIETKEQEVQDKHGRWYNMQIRPFKTSEEKIEGALLVFIDIQSIKGVEKLTRSLDELKAARLYNQWIVESVREPLLILDDHFNVISGNPAFYRTFQVSKEETENKLLYTLGNGQWDIPRLKQLLEEILPQSADFNDFLVQHHFLNLGHRSILLNARRLGNQNQILLGIQDITDRKKIEEMVAVEKRNLEKVNHELDQFVHIASHDLYAPLRAIGSFASILQKDCQDKLDPDSADSLKQIIQGAQRMTDLINDLLTLSRISKVTNPYESVNLYDLIESVKRRLQTEIEQNHTLITIQEHMPAIHCDRIKMTEVFLNLINNAIKYSSKNPRVQPKIEIGMTGKQDLYEFFIKDNGIGIDPRYHLQIFDMFKRLHSKDQYEGTGAGLYIVKTIIEEHGGSVWVESQIDAGSTFYFTIPKNLQVINNGSIDKVDLYAAK